MDHVDGVERQGRLVEVAIVEIARLEGVVGRRHVVRHEHRDPARRQHDLGAAVEGLAHRIEAGAAFGTGHHGTTVGCLQAYHDLFERVAGVVRQALTGCDR